MGSGTGRSVRGRPCILPESYHFPRNLRDQGRIDIYGLQFDSFTNQPQISPCPAPFGLNGCNPDFLNIDLTATEKFGKWEFGGVAYASADLTRPIGNYQKQGDIAVGVLC